MGSRSVLRLVLLLVVALGLGLAVSSPERALAFEPPNAQADDMGSVTEGTCEFYDVIANDLDDDTDNLELFLLGIDTPPTYGTADYAGQREVQYCVPAGAVTGDTFDQFSYEMSDGTLSSFAPVSVSIVNDPSNDPPTAADDVASVTQGGCVQINVVANDTFPSGTAPSVAIYEAPAFGTASLVPGSQTLVSYCIGSGVVADDTQVTFSYSVSDNVGTAYAVVTVTVRSAANVAPVAVDDTASTAANACVDIYVLANDTDANGDALSVGSTLTPTQGTATVGATSEWITYCPPTRFVGQATFEYIVLDGPLGDTGLVTVTVQNTAPVVTAPSSQIATEGQSPTIALGSFADASGPANGPWSVSVAWGDGTPATTLSRTVTSTIPGQPHTFRADGTYTVTVTVTDPGGLSGSASFVVGVANVAPTLQPGASQSSSEGTLTSFALGSFTDPGADDTAFSVTVTWDDGSAAETFSVTRTGPSGSTAVTRAHRFTRDGTFTVRVTVKDGDNQSSNTRSFTATVSNVAPVLRQAANQTSTEASPKTFSLSYFTDPGADDNPWTVTVTWGDGSAAETWTTAGNQVVGESRTLARAHTFTGSGTYTVSVKVVDGDGGASAIRTFSVTVANVAPTLRQPGNQTATEGAARTFSLSYFSDPGTDDDPWTVSVNWGDGTAVESYTTSGNPVLGSSRVLYRPHTFAGSGTYTVSVTVADADGGSSSKTFQVAVANVAPTLRQPANQTAVEGRATTFSLSYFSDPGTDDNPWTVTVNWGDGTAPETYTTGGNPVLGSSRVLYRPHTFSRDGAFTATVSVSDGDGGSATKTFTVNVTNAAPVLRQAANQSAARGTSKTFSLGYFTDPGTDDAPWSVTVAWGDGTSQTYTTSGDQVVGESRVLFRPHTYASPGSYTVTVTVTDPDGGTSSKTFTVTVS